MKKLIRYRRNLFSLKKRGFTIIELAIVIAIIAIIAVGIIAALNPIEQRRRAEDVKVKAVMTEFMKAINRWTAVHSYVPFCTDGTQTSCTDANPYFLDLTGDQNSTGISAGTRIVQKLIDAKEITTNYDVQSSAEQQKILIAYSVTTNKMTLCFSPSSQKEVANISGNVYCTGTGGGSVACTLTFNNATPPRTIPPNSSVSAPPNFNKNFCITN